MQPYAGAIHTISPRPTAPVQSAPSMLASDITVAYENCARLRLVRTQHARRSSAPLRTAPSKHASVKSASVSCSPPSSRR
jgi:hypothetical protein